jgi:hypothetical protein
MLAGARPFPTRPRDPTSWRAEDWTIARALAECAPGAPRELVAITMKCLALEPTERFADGTDLLRALSAMDLGPRARSRAKLAAWIALAVAAGAGGATAVVMVLSPRSTPPSASPAVPSTASAGPVGASLPSLTEAIALVKSGDEPAAREVLGTILAPTFAPEERTPSEEKDLARASLVLGRLNERSAPRPESATVETVDRAAEDVRKFVADQLTLYYPAFVRMDTAACATAAHVRALEHAADTYDAMVADVLADARKRGDVAVLARATSYKESLSSLASSWRTSIRAQLDSAAVANYAGTDPLDGSDCGAELRARAAKLRAR